MKLHPSTFEYLKPTEAQTAQMAKVRAATATYARALEDLLPNGFDKELILRDVRTIGMWANVSVTRETDGTPRS